MQAGNRDILTIEFMQLLEIDKGKEMDSPLDSSARNMTLLTA